MLKLTQKVQFVSLFIISIMSFTFFTGCSLFYSTAYAKQSGVDCRLEIDKPVIPAGKKESAIIKVTLDAPPPPSSNERPPVNLSIVLAVLTHVFFY